MIEREFVVKQDVFEVLEADGEMPELTRELWEEVFWEDSREFVEYYYKYKAPLNTTFLIKIGQKIVSMLHASPNKMIVKTDRSYSFMASYIVGVATKEEYRHKGYMKRLIDLMLSKLYSNKEPFAFLMPANPDIYRPFSFSYIYEREQYQFQEGSKDFSMISKLVRGETERIDVLSDKSEFDRDANYCSTKKNRTLCRLSMDKSDELASFAKSVMADRYQFYIMHDKEYFQTLFREIEAQNGGIFALLCDDEIEGYFVCAMDGEQPFLQEIMFGDQKYERLLFKTAANKKPIIMGRIIHLETMLSYFRSKVKKEIYFKFEDHEILENNGYYYWLITEDKSRLKKLNAARVNEAKIKFETSPNELIEVLFGKDIENRVITDELDGIGVLKEGIINEIV